MVLKQRFEQGRTQFKDIGSDFMIVTRASEEFQDIIDKHFHDGTDKKDIHSFILYGDREIEPMYTDFAQWIYTNDGQLFLNLTTPRSASGHVVNTPHLQELQNILAKMDSCKKENGFMAVSGGEYTFFEEKPNGMDSLPITRGWVLKMIDQA